MNWKFWEWFDKGPPTQTLIEPRFEPMTDEKNVLVLSEYDQYKVSGAKMDAVRPNVREVIDTTTERVADEAKKRREQKDRDDTALRVLLARKEAERDRQNMNANRK